MDLKTFQIDGHDYTVTPHDGIEGIPIVTELAAIATEPLLRLLKTQIIAGQGAGLDMADVLQNLDISELSTNLRESLHRLGERPDIIVKLFSRTTRDGMPLANSAAFRQAYQGRWPEMVKAMFEIVKINGFLPF